MPSRPLVELNTTQNFLGAFREQGAGPLNLVVNASRRDSGTAGAGVEFGGEVPFGVAAVLRPFASYEFKRTLWGNTQNVSASFEGAPPGVAPFLVTQAPDRELHQVSAGFDLINWDNTNFRIQYNGVFGSKTRQDGYALKIAIPF